MTTKSGRRTKQSAVDFFLANANSTGYGVITPAEAEKWAHAEAEAKRRGWTFKRDRGNEFEMSGVVSVLDDSKRIIFREDGHEPFTNKTYERVAKAFLAYEALEYLKKYGGR